MKQETKEDGLIRRALSSLFDPKTDIHARCRPVPKDVTTALRRSAQEATFRS